MSSLFIYYICNLFPIFIKRITTILNIDVRGGRIDLMFILLNYFTDFYFYC